MNHHAIQELVMVLFRDFDFMTVASSYTGSKTGMHAMERHDSTIDFIVIARSFGDNELQ